MTAFDDVAAAAQSLLRHKHRKLHPRIDRDLLGRCVATWGEGPDPLEGERLIGLFPLTGNDQVGTANKVLRAFDPARAAGKHLAGMGWDMGYGALVTDRAVVLRGAGTTARVPYDRIAAVDRSGGAAVAIGYSAVYVTLDDGRTWDLDLGPQLGGPMVDFLEAVLALREAGGLEPTPRPPLPDAPQEALEALRSRLVALDPRTEALLGLAAQALDEGTFEGDAARDLLVRLEVHAVANAGARGRHAGAWVTALPPDALRRFFGELGVPERVTPGVLARLLPARTLSSGPYELDVRTFALDDVPLGAWSMRAPSRILQQPVPHHEAQPDTVDALHKGLLRAEARWLARRLIAGPEADLDALLALDDASVLERMRERLERPLPASLLDRLRLPAKVLAEPLPVVRAPLRQRPSAPADERPIGLVLAGVLQVPAGAMTMIFGSAVSFTVLVTLGGLLVRIAERIRFIDEGAVAALVALGSLGVASLQFALAGPLRLGLGLLLLLPFRWAPGLVLAAATLSGLLSLLALDPIGAVASLGLLYAWTRPSARAWARGTPPTPSA